MEEEKKRCPYCGEEILAIAKKCKHCGEWLPEEVVEDPKKQIPCPICGEDIDEGLDVCPYCHEKVEQSYEINKSRIAENTQDSITSKKKLTWIIIGAIIATFLFPVASFVIIGYTFYYRKKALDRGSRFFNNGGLWYITHWGISLMAGLHAIMTFLMELFIAVFDDSESAYVLGGNIGRFDILDLVSGVAGGVIIYLFFQLFIGFKRKTLNSFEDCKKKFLVNSIACSVLTLFFCQQVYAIAENRGETLFDGGATMTKIVAMGAVMLGILWWLYHKVQQELRKYFNQ